MGLRRSWGQMSIWKASPTAPEASTSSVGPWAGDPPLLHHHEVVGVAQGEIQIVDDHGDGLALATVQVAHEGHEVVAGADVQIGGGLVKHDEVGVLGERAGQMRPLALAAGELVHVVAAKAPRRRPVPWRLPRPRGRRGRGGRPIPRCGWRPQATRASTVMGGTRELWASTAIRCARSREAQTKRCRGRPLQPAPPPGAEGPKPASPAWTCRSRWGRRCSSPRPAGMAAESPSMKGTPGL